MGLLDQPLIVEIPAPEHPRKTLSKANKLLKKSKKRRRGQKKRRKLIKARIPKMTYKQYMGSAYWKVRKRSYFQQHGKKCEVCGSTCRIALHHKVYKPAMYGKEPDRDLVALCPRHHQMFHDLHKLSGNMRKDTDTFVAHMKQVEQYPLSLDDV